MALETLDLDFDDLPEDVSAIGVMDGKGDTKHVWRKTKPQDVEEARLLYQTLRDKGYRAFRLKTGNRKGEQMTEFDPEAGRMLFIPPFQGG